MDLRIMRLHLRPRGGRPRRRDPCRDGVRGHPGGLVLPGLRRPQGGLLAVTRAERANGASLSGDGARSPARGLRCRWRRWSSRSGMSTLGAEIAAARLMAPFFGASTVIWANTIAVVLVALSVGLQARRAARRPAAARGGAGRAGAARQRAAGRRAVRRAPVPVAERERVRHAVGGRVPGLAVRDAGAGRGAAAAARRGLAVGDAAASSRRSRRPARSPGGCTRSRPSARWWACSSSSLWAIEAIGTQRTFLVLAAVPARVAALGLRPARAARARCAGRRARAAGRARPSRPRTARVLYETETPYQYARVVQVADGTRRLELNEGQAIHSLWRPGHGADRRLLGRLPGAAVRDRLAARPPGADRRARHGGRDGPAGVRALLPATRGSTPSTSTPSCSRSAAATSACTPRPQLREYRRRTRGRSCARPTSATTRSSSTPTASPTSRST